MIILMAAAICTLSGMADAQPPGVVFPDYYPQEFSGVGRIDRMTDRQIVINDQQYMLSAQTTYHTLEQEYAYRSAFRPGMLVGYVSGSANEILSLWFIEK